MRFLRILPAALAALVPLGLALVPSTSSASAPTPAFGAHGVLNTHRELFRALDAKDASGVARYFTASKKLGMSFDGEGNGGEPPTFQLALPGAGGAVREVSDAGSGAAAVLDWARADGRTSTRILEGWTDCYSENLGFAVLEFERSGAAGTPAQRYRSTSFARATDAGWKLYYWHIAAEASDGVVAAR